MTKPYCSQCGENKNMSYIDQYANGEYWKCNDCGYQSIYEPANEDEETTPILLIEKVK